MPHADLHDEASESFFREVTASKWKYFQIYIVLSL